jgi:hypothetical protein
LSLTLTEGIVFVFLGSFGLLGKAGHFSGNE